jgi:hypothetical protein
MSATVGGPHRPQLLPGLTAIEHYLHSLHSDHAVHITARQIITVGVVAFILFFIIAPGQMVTNLNLAIFFSPIWMTIILWKSAYARFLQMNRARFASTQEYQLLEIRIPRDITKSPAAMEAFFTSLHIGSGESNWYKKIVQGASRPSWAFEIVSLGGRVHLYIWTRKGYRRLVESFLYAQYPDVEIIEAEDYSLLVDPSHHGYSMFAAEYKMTKENNAYPLKTYIDYKMEPGDKPEETVDPLAQIIEVLGSLGPGEQFWIQFVIRMSKNEKFEGLVGADGKPYTWRTMVKEAIEEVRAQTVKKTKFVDPVTGKTEERESFPNPSRGQSDGIASIERKGSKAIFDVGVRTIYLGTDEAFQGIMIPAQLTLFKPYTIDGGNGLSLQGVWGGAFNDLPWEDRGGHHKAHLYHEVVQMYRRRQYFSDPYKGDWIFLSAEELASLYHIPSAAITTPGLPRIQSSTSDAPPNLPL